MKKEMSLSQTHKSENSIKEKVASEIKTFPHSDQYFSPSLPPSLTLSLESVKSINKNALATVDQLVGHYHANQKVVGSIPGQGTSLGCRFSTQLGLCQR